LQCHPRWGCSGGASIPGVGRLSGGGGGVEEHQGVAIYLSVGRFGVGDGRRGELDGAAGAAAMGSNPARL